MIQAMRTKAKSPLKKASPQRKPAPPSKAKSAKARPVKAKLSIAAKPEGPKRSAREEYAAKSERSRQREARIATEGRDISPIPAVKNPKRRAAGLKSLKYFLLTYFPKAFRLGFSADHEKVLRRIEEVVVESGLFALAMPRGRGKTTILARAVIWAVLTGRHRYVMLIAANEGKASKLLDVIRRELSRNPLLLADFPEVCYPIWQLRGIANKAKGQLLDGEPTLIEWSGDTIVLPTVPKSKASGSLIECAGLLAATRGAQFTTDDGEVIRPTLILFDDPQTRESARSLDQTSVRHEILVGDLFGLAGPGENISMLGAMTSIYQGDLACLLLDRDRSPEWQAETFAMLKSFPENMELWEQYYELRRTALRRGDKTFFEARQFYRQNFGAMNHGAAVDWPEAVGKGDLTAIETAMVLFFFNEDSFWAERQNNPRNLLDGEDQFWDANQIATKVSAWPRRTAPLEVEYVTAFIDVHGKLHYWMICGWSPSFEGFVLDYGVTPKQRSQFFAMSKARPSLTDVYKRAGRDGAIYAGLRDTITEMFALKLEREDGEELSINRCLIDSNWNRPIVEKVIREHPSRARLTPSLGHAYSAMERPLSQYRTEAGRIIGEEWTVPPLPSKRALRRLMFDTNYWKTRVHRGLATPQGDRGCISLYGKAGQRHDLLARHLCAEFRTIVTAKRTTDVWGMRPGEVDNHWLDCATGCAAAAAVLGCKRVGTTRRKLPGRTQVPQPETMEPEDPRVTYIQ